VDKSFIQLASYPRSPQPLGNYSAANLIDSLFDDSVSEEAWMKGYIEGGKDRERKKCSRDQSANDHSCQRFLHFGTSTRGERHWHETK
jgi:hypothetical protein